MLTYVDNNNPDFIIVIHVCHAIPCLVFNKNCQCRWIEFEVWQWHSLYEDSLFGGVSQDKRHVVTSKCDLLLAIYISLQENKSGFN